MQFIQHKLGHLQRGAIVEVTLNAQANVKLMSSSNFNNYKNARRHSYLGRLAKKSPLRLEVPSSGVWFVTVDLGGHSGKIRSSVRVLPGLLKPIQERPLSEINLLDEETPTVAQSQKEYDVFISHASEDKEQLVRPLAIALQNHGLTVWYDEFELRIGDSLRQNIDKGISNSRFGIVVLSSSFFHKGWTNYELDGLVTRSVSGSQVLLPIWHNVSKDEVMGYSSSLADKVARSTSTHTTAEIAKEIADRIKNEKPPYAHPQHQLPLQG